MLEIFKKQLLRASMLNNANHAIPSVKNQRHLDRAHMQHKMH